MAADSTLVFSVSMTGAQQATAEMQKLSNETEKLSQRTQRAAKVTSETNKEIQQTATASSSSAMGLLFLSQAIEDVQYGFGAVLNNIPLIIMSMGGSAGLAGAASIAAVGVYQVTKSLDLFGTQSKAAAKSASELADQKIRTAEGSKKLLAAQQAEAASLKEIEKSIAAVNQQYEESLRLIKESADAKIRAAEREAGIYDEAANLAFAEIDLRKARGEITQEQADSETSKLRIAAIERKKADEELKARIRLEEESAAATAARAKAQQQMAIAADLSAKSEGMLTEKEREILKQQKSAAFQQAVAVQAEKEKLSGSVGQGLVDYAIGAMVNFTSPHLGLLGDSPQELERRRVEAEYKQQRLDFLKKELERLKEQEREADARLAADKAARGRSGVSDAKELEQKIVDAKQNALNAVQAEVESRKRIGEISSDLSAQQKMLDTRASTLRIEAQTKAEELKKQRAEEALRAQQKAQQEQEEAARLAERFSDQSRGLLQFSRNVAEGDGGGRIIAGQKPRINNNAIEGSVRALAAEAARAGADGYSEAELNALLKQTSESMRRLVNVNHATKKFMEDLNEKIQEMLATQNNNRR